MVSATIGLQDRTADTAMFPVVRVNQTAPVATLPGAQTAWQVVAIDCDATNATPIRLARPLQIRWPKKNAPVELDFALPLDDPTFTEIDFTAAGNREVQVYRNGHLLFWGKPTTRRANSKSRMWTITCKDPLWYFTKRHIGKADRTNYLTNGDFEAGTSGWFTSGSVTFTAATDDPFVGTKYGKLVGTGTDGRIYQRFPIHSGNVGLALFLTVWRKVKTFTAAAGFNLGITFARVGKTGAGSFDSISIDSTTHRNVYERQSLVVNMPPNVTEVIEAAIWVGDGENHVDACTITVEESIDLSSYGAYDQATILSRIVLYAQGRGPYGSLGVEKSDLHVNTSMAPTGVKKQRIYQLADHQKVYDGGDGYGVCDEFLKADDGVDWRLEVTPTTKTLVTYYPAFAPVRDDLPLTYVNYPDDPALNVSEGIDSWDYGDSIEPSANQIAILGGWGSTQDRFASREEGGYNNPASLGGLTLELVDTAPDGAPVGALQSIANGRGAQVEDPIVTPTFTLIEPRDPVTDVVLKQYIGVLIPGVVVPVNVIDGTLVLQGNIALASVTLDCSDDSLAVTVDA